MRGWNTFVGVASRWNCTRSMFVSALVGLPLALHDLSRVPCISMGHSFARNGIPGTFFRAIANAAPTLADRRCLTHCFMAPPAAAVQADVSIRLREIAKPGRDLAKFYRADLPL